jgi:hypothetical protein
MANTWVGIAMAAAIGLGGAACGDDGGSTPDGADGRQTVVELPATVNRDLDLLVVMDDSPGLIEIQQSISNSLPVFVERLQRAPGGLPDLHLGVVSTDMGTKASGSPTPGPAIGQVGNGGCAGTGKNGALQKYLAGTDLEGSFLSDVKQTDGSRLRNYTGDLATMIGKMIKGGAGGCGFEQPLAAMRAALGGQPANAGFLRQDALLAVVIVADEDDCSVASPMLLDPAAASTLGSLSSFRCTRFGVTCAGGGATPDQMKVPGVKTECGPSPSNAMLDDIGQFRDFLRGLKSDPRKIMVAGIVGPPEPFQVELRPPPGGGNPEPALAHACSVQGPIGIQVASPAPRLHGFLGEFPDRSTSSTVCTADNSAGLVGIADLIGRVMGSPCVNAALADAKPAEPGLQPDCIVEDVVGTAATKIEPCDAGARQPCWRLEADAAMCAGPGNLKLVVDRASAPPPETTTRMRCKLE